MWKFICVGFPTQKRCKGKEGCGKEFSLETPAGICPYCDCVYVKRLDFKRVSYESPVGE